MSDNEAKNDEFDEIQKNEIEVLKSIFGESFELMGEKRKKKSSRYCFKITLVPYFDNPKENYCSVALQIRYTKTYPNEMPAFWIKKIKGLSEAEIEELTKLVQEKGEEHLGTEMVYDLTQTIEAYLIQHNKKPKSFYDQMLDRQRQQEIAEMAKEQEQLQLKQKEQFELESKIQNEMKKKEEVLRRLGRDDSSDDLHQIKSMKDSWGLSSEDEDRGGGPASSTSDEMGSSTENKIVSNTNVKGKASPLASTRVIHNNHTATSKFDDFYSTQGPMLLERTKEHEGVISPPHHTITTKKEREKIQWTKTKDLGEGAFGKVYKGINRTNGQIIVIKEISILSSSMDATAEHNQMELVESIQRDIEASRTKLVHPNLVKYLGTEFVDNTLYIFTEYVPGSVQSVFSQAKKFEEPVFKKYAKQILMALNHLHGAGFTCNNLKLSNLLLDNFGNIKISDYMAIRRISDLKNGASAKNANYWSPDVRKRQARERKEDIYQLGMILVEMASGTQYAENIPKHISKEAKDFISLCLKADEKDRPEAVKLLAHKFVLAEPSFSENSTMNDITYPPHHPLAASDMSYSSVLVQSHDSSVASRTSLSRYRQDFDELEVLGRGGFGQVVKARNKLDGRIYAIKKIRFGRTDSRFMQKLVREVTTLARLHHQHVVRYYHAWIDPAEEEDIQAFESTLDEIDSLLEMSDEDEGGEDFDDETNLNFSEPTNAPATKMNDDDDDASEDENDDWLESASISRSKRAGVEDETSVIEQSKAIEATHTPHMGGSGKKEAKILYIQMEYCTTKTLRKIIDEGIKDEDDIWRFFRQIIEGLNHIHSQGIIHRDLKPGNIFIDSENNIKIGDFGLATSSVTRITSSIGSSVSNDILDQSLTIGVGTPFYLAPEQDRIGAHYNQKVDIYSLGIIFFEMCYRFSTAMERALVLKNLREKIPKFPPDFADKHPDKVDLIRWVLEHDPDKRPTTMELLDSDHLPPKLEEEILKEALRSIATPNTTIFSLLMEKLFSLTPDSHLDYTYDFNAPNASFEEKSQLELFTRKSSVKQMKKIFKKHGATQLDNSLLMPKHTLPQQKNVVHIMDDTGLLLQLPYDLTAPFARFVARQKIKNLRRYTIAKVYRKNVVGGQPRELTECDFDIVGPMQHKFVYCSEVLKVLCEVLTDLSDLGPFMIKINNYKILDGILGAFEIEPKIQDQLRLLIGGIQKNTWVSTRKEILYKNLIPPKMIEWLGTVFTSTEPMSTVLDRIEQALGNKSRLVVEGVHELRALLHFAGTFGVSDKLKFDLSLVYNYQQFSDIVYQAYLTKHDIGVVAAGGCYDFLLSHFSTVPTAPNAKVGRFATSLQEGYRGMKQGLETTAVGVNFALDKIVAFVHRQKIENQNTVDDLSTKTETDVFIYSVNKNMLEDRIQLANLLWSMNIKAEYMYREDISLDELGTLCKNMGVFCIIVLRDATYRNGVVKIKTMDNLKAETVVKIKDLPELVAQSKQKAQKSKRPLHKQGSSQDVAIPEYSLNQARNQHIDVEILGNRTERASKAKKKIENKAQNIISPVLKSLITYSNIYKVAAVDVPAKVIKEVVAHNRMHAEAINLGAEKYSNYKRTLLDLQEFLHKNRNLPFVFVYSIKDDGYIFVPCALDPQATKEK